MVPIYDSGGRTVGWRRRYAIFDVAGKPRAFIRQRGVFDYDGRYLGRTEDGWYRDPAGLAVAFEEGATGGPLPPSPLPGAIAPLAEPDPPPPAVTDPPPGPRIRSATWSDMGWDEFMSGSMATTGR